MARESFHMNDFIYKSAAIGMLVKPHVQANNTDNTKAPIYWPYVWWFRRWSIDSPQKWPVIPKRFHVMTSLWLIGTIKVTSAEDRDNRIVTICALMGLREENNIGLAFCKHIVTYHFSAINLSMLFEWTVGKYWQSHITYVTTYHDFCAIILLLSGDVFA